MTAPLRGPGFAQLRRLADVVYDPWIDQRPLRIYSAEQLADRITAVAADVLVVESDSVGGPVFERGLRVVAATRGDPSNVDIPGATAAGIPVLHTPEDRVIASVTRLGNLTARKLVVLVNPATQQYLIDWERSALVNGLVPAQFTVAEDNKTYDLSGQTGPLMEILQILKANNVPLNRMVDIRSNPALRQQVQAVVRRAAERQAPAAEPASQGSIAERLAELESLRASGAVNAAEYESKRAQIISEI